jgi:hypothetical protein
MLGPLVLWVQSLITAVSVFLTRCSPGFHTSAHHSTIAAWYQTKIVNAWLNTRFYAIGLICLVRHSSITPCYHIKVTGLTIVAYITNRSYLVRHPDRLPRLIARGSNKVLQTFNLTADDIDYIYAAVGVHAGLHQERKWRPDWWVLQLMGRANPLYQPPTTREIDLTSYRLDGPRWTQGMGLVGSGICLALLEEFGRWPEEHGYIAGRVFTWDTNDLAYGKIPARFVTVSGVEETVQFDNCRITVEWQDLEVGMSRGLKATAVPLEELELLDFDDTPPLLELLPE